MDNFWKWLLKANARGVLGCSILALVLMCAWWTWKEFSPADRGERIASMPAPDKERTSLGLMEYFRDPGNTNAVVLPENPFIVAWNMPKEQYTPKAVTPPVVETPRERPRPRLPVKPTPGQPVVAVEPMPGEPATPERPAFENITLTYKGVFKRTDGKSLALIEDTKGNATRFYHEGRSLYGLKVKAIDTTSVEIIGVDGETVTVKIRDPQVIKIPLQ